METKKNYVSNRPSISMKDLKKMFPYMSEDELEYDMQNNEWIKLEKFLEQESKQNEAYRIRAERTDVKRLIICIDWKRSRTWGYNPHLRYKCIYKDGTYESGTATCTGCNYDKASTVVAEAFNACLSGMLWRKRNKKQEAPYGICRGKGCWFPSFSGGIGVSCYPAITEWLGGKWEHTDHDDCYDRYEINF